MIGLGLSLPRVLVSWRTVAALPSSATLLMFAGQSNMAGRQFDVDNVTLLKGKATIPATVPSGSAVGYDQIFAPAVSWAKIWNAPDLDTAGSFPTAALVSGTAFVNFDAARDPASGSTDIHWGPELAFLWQRYQRDTSRPLYVHKCVKGGTSVTNAAADINWSASITGDATKSLALAAARRTNAALAAMKAADPALTTITIELVWCQGEGDASAGGDPLNYYTNLTALFAYWRSALAPPSGTSVTIDVAALARIDTAVAASVQPNGRSGLEVVKSAIMQVGSDEAAQVVSLNSYTKHTDNIHYNRAAYITMGTDLETAAKGLAARTPPTFAVSSPALTLFANRPVDSCVFPMRPPNNTPVMGDPTTIVSNVAVDAVSYNGTGLPPGTVLDRTTGFLLVTAPSALVPGTYTPTIRRTNGDGTQGVAVTPTINIVADNSDTLQGRAFVLDPANAASITLVTGTVFSVANSDPTPSGVSNLVGPAASRRPGIGTFPGKSKNGFVSDTTTGTGSTALDVLTTGATNALVYTENVLDAILGCVCRPITGGAGTQQTVIGIQNAATGGSALPVLSIIYNYTTQTFGIQYLQKGNGLQSLYYPSSSAVDNTHIVIARQIGIRLFLSVNGTEVEFTGLNLGTVPRDFVQLPSDTGGLCVFGRNPAVAGQFTGWIGRAEWGVSASAAQYAAFAARLAAW